MTIQFMPMAPQHTQAVYQIEQRAHTHPWSANMIGDLSSQGACRTLCWWMRRWWAISTRRILSVK